MATRSPCVLETLIFAYSDISSSKELKDVVEAGDVRTAIHLRVYNNVGLLFQRVVIGLQENC